MNDNDLKSLLAKMLPETVYLYDNPSTKMQTLFWKELGSPRAVLDTELLHLTSLVEAGLLFSFRRLYYDKLQLVCSQKLSKGLVVVIEECISATWQQRVTALASVKGVTPCTTHPPTPSLSQSA